MWHKPVKIARQVYEQGLKVKSLVFRSANRCKALFNKVLVLSRLGFHTLCLEGLEFNSSYKLVANINLILYDVVCITLDGIHAPEDH